MLYRPYQPGDFVQLYAVEELCFDPPFRFDQQYIMFLLTYSFSYVSVVCKPTVSLESGVSNTFPRMVENRLHYQRRDQNLSPGSGSFQHENSSE